MPTDITDLKLKSRLPVAQAGGKIVAEFFEANKAAIAAVLPKHVTTERIMKIALGALRQTPKLRECTSESLFGAVVQCAQLGLEPNTVMGQAYLVPFRNRKKNSTDVQMIVGYRGMLDLARRSGQIVSIAAHEVCSNDEFTWEYGLEEKLRHIPASEDRGDVTHFYAVAKLVGGGHAYEVMPVEDVRKVMRSTQSKGEYGPWRDHFIPMGRKTVIRQLFKYLPVSIELATAVAVDAATETESGQHIETTLEGEWRVEEDTREDGAGEDQGQVAEAAQSVTETAQPTYPKKFTDNETGEEGWEDSSGAFFDPQKHAMARNGVPTVKANGEFRARRNVRKEERQQEPSNPDPAREQTSGPDDTGEQEEQGTPFGNLE